MNNPVKQHYQGWSITVTAEHNLCSNYSFDLTDPDSRSRHVSMGGDNVERALERAREMIDLELELAQ